MERLWSSRNTWAKAAILGIVALIVMMLSVSPQSVGPTGVIVWFAVFYVTVLSFLVVIDGYLVKKSTTIHLNTLLRHAVWATGIVSLIALRSLGQLQARDLLLIGLLIALLVFYLRRHNNK